MFYIVKEWVSDPEVSPQSQIHSSIWNQTVYFIEDALNEIYVRLLHLAVSPRVNW